MIYLLCYLAIGALIMAVAILRTPYSNDLDQLALEATGGTGVFDKILAAFLVPLLGCLLVVVAWPLVLAKTAQEMWRNRGTPAKESNVPQPKFDDPEVRFFHPRINGKIVSNEEWQAARSQRADSLSKVMDTEVEVIANSVIKKAMDSARRSTYKDEL